jgi:hypothetical protein
MLIEKAHATHWIGLLGLKNCSGCCGKEKNIPALLKNEF